MDYDETIYAEAQAYLKTALNKWKKQLPDLWEDAFQEGMIQCWRDVEAGVTPKLKVLRRASMAANKYFHRNGEYSFGKPKKSRDGLRSNQKTVEKIQTYLEETKPSRAAGTWPMISEVAQAIGISDSSAGKILRDIKQGRIDHMVYREDGRMDWNHYSTMSVELLNTVNDEGRANLHWTDDVRFGESWEDDLVGDMDLISLLDKLNERHRTVLYMYFYEGHTCTVIAEHLGFTTNPSAKGHRFVEAALGQLRILMDPWEGECSTGHARTPETSSLRKRADGVWFRVCGLCKRGGAEKANARNERVGSTKCPQGHEKTIRDSRGALRCHECRKAAQRKYYANNKQYYKDYNKKYKANGQG